MQRIYTKKYLTKRNWKNVNARRRTLMINILINNQTLKYVFFGGCTTGVNLACFWMLRALHMQLDIANLISIVVAVLFAYIVNEKFVFQAHTNTHKDRFGLFCKFISARTATMIVELFGVWFFVKICQIGDMTGKTITQVVVLVLNYIFSKWFVFTKKVQ